MSAPRLDLYELDLTKTYYCPKCGRKKLCSGRRWQEIGQHDRYDFYGCTYNRPGKTYRAKMPSGPPCGLIIEIADRDATLDDYNDVLGRLAQINVPEIQQWLLKNKTNINKRGMEVLYEGTLVDVIRRRDSAGVGVALYWRAETWDDDPDTLNPFSTINGALRSNAAHYVMFRGTPVGPQFQTNGTDVWASGNDAQVFTGALGKKLKAKIVEWAAALEKELPSLIEQCRAEDARWKAEEAHLKSAIGEIVSSGHFHISDYRGNTKTGGIWLRSVSPEEALSISRALNCEFKLNALVVAPHSVSIEKAIELGKVMAPTKLSFDINFLFKPYYSRRDVPQRRLNLDEAVAVVKILRGGA